MDDLKSLIAKTQMSFLSRSIARELTDRLFDGRPMGEIEIQAEAWEKDWGVTLSDIWAVIDQLETLGFWVTQQGLEGSKLFCPLMASAAKAVAKSKQRKGMKTIKALATTDRAATLSLDKVGPSAISEVSDKIPKEKRKEALAGGYCGWLPASNFGVSGLVFKPDQGLRAKLLEEYPGACIDSAFGQMFHDLKASKDRPGIPHFPFWIRRWLKENPTRVVIKKTEDELDALIAQQMDDY
jgi:hypothetical protein